MSNKYSEYYDEIQEYNIIDDLFFHKVMEDAGAAEEDAISHFKSGHEDHGKGH